MTERRGLRSTTLTAAGLLCVLAWPARAADPRHTSPIQISDDGATVWVVNPDSDSVGKLATATNSLLGEHPVGDNPRTLALGGGSVYVANQGSQDLTPKPNADTVMRLADGSGAVQATHQLPFGCAPYGVIYNEAGGGGAEVWVTCERSQSVVVLDAALTTVVGTVPLDWPDPRGMALSADRTKLYVLHFLTRSPNNDAHVTEIDTATRQVARVLSVPPDHTTCETINSGKGVLNVLSAIHLTPPNAPAALANQLWIGGVMQNNLTKGLFLNDERFGGRADPLLCEGGPNAGRRCATDDDCDGGDCKAGFAAISRNLYKASFHDITRFAISKIDLATGAVVGKVDIDEANQGTDLVFSADGLAAFVVDQFFNSLHVFNAHRGQNGDPTTVFAGPSRFGPGGTSPTQDCTGGSFLTGSETPFILPPQAQLVPIAADPRLLDGNVALTGNEYDVTTGAMRAVPDSVGTTPHGIAIHPDGSKVYVANFLSRNVSVVKADSFFCPNGNACQTRLDCNGCAPRVAAVVPSITAPDPLPPQLLDGKILFHTAARDASVPNGIGLAAAAPRFNFDDPDVLEPVGAVVSVSHDASYVACISCHPEGGMDGRSWDFSQFGASVRNTMDLRGRPSLAPGVCTAPAGLSCTTDSQCAGNGVGICTNDPSVVCELDIQCGSCAANSPTPGITCIADRQCGGVCSNDAQVTCTANGDCGGTCREDGVTPCADDDDCDFGCNITNTCDFFSCETQTCSAAKCVAASAPPGNVGAGSNFLNPMVTVHWNGDRDEVEDFEFTYRSLMGAGDCDGVEDLPDKCIGALVMRSNVAKPQEIFPDLGPSNRGLSPRLDHMADYVYSLTSFVRNPNLGGGPSPDAAAGANIFFSSIARCAECHDGPSASNQHFSDKRPDPTYPLGLQGRPGDAESVRPAQRRHLQRLRPRRPARGRDGDRAVPERRDPDPGRARRAARLRDADARRRLEHRAVQPRRRLRDAAARHLPVRHLARRLRRAGRRQEPERPARHDVEPDAAPAPPARGLPAGAARPGRDAAGARRASVHAPRPRERALRSQPRDRRRPPAGEGALPGAGRRALRPGLPARRAARAHARGRRRGDVRAHDPGGRPRAERLGHRRPLPRPAGAGGAGHHGAVDQAEATRRRASTSCW